MKAPRLLLLLWLTALSPLTAAETPSRPTGVVVTGCALKPGAYSVTSRTTLLDVWRACGGPNRVWRRIIVHTGFNAAGQRVVLGQYRRGDYATEELWLKQLSLIGVVDGDIVNVPEIVC